jgi:hypothetical protein
MLLIILLKCPPLGQAAIFIWCLTPSSRFNDQARGDDQEFAGERPSFMKRRPSLFGVLNNINHVSEIDDICGFALASWTVDGIPACAPDATAAQASEIIAVSAAIIKHISLTCNQSRFEGESDRPREVAALEGSSMSSRRRGVHMAEGMPRRNLVLGLDRILTWQFKANFTIMAVLQSDTATVAFRGGYSVPLRISWTSSSISSGVVKGTWA